MKAYQMRITLEGSKPAIYRQCIVPAGITFSQFALILNKVMGWESCHLFSFRLPEVEFQEQSDGYDFGDRGNSVQEASTTYVNEYLEKNACFTYLYDFGDSWEHRVEIEAILDSYEYTYPQVLKYKGACPIEDCGGISGYYHMMAVLKDHKHPDYEGTLEGALSRGYTNTYSQKRTNAEFMEYYYVKEGRGEKRKSPALLQDLASKKGLKTSKNPKNTKEPKNLKNPTSDSKPTIEKRQDREITDQIRSTMLGILDEEYGMDHTNAQVEELAYQLVQEIGDMDIDDLNLEGYAVTSNHVSLKDIIKGESKSNLAGIAADLLKIPVKSLKKNELVQKISQYLLDPVNMYQYMLTFTDEAMVLFQKMIDAGNAYMPSCLELGAGQMLLASGYVAIRKDEAFEVADDVAKVFQSIDTPEFHAKRKQISWLVQCLKFSQMFYGACPIKVLVKLFNKGKGLKTTQKNLAALMEELPDVYVVKIDDWYVDYSLAEDHSYEKLLQEQGNVDYYIPAKEQITDIAAQQYFPDEENLEHLREFFMDRKDKNPFVIEEVLSDIQMSISRGAEVEEIAAYLEEKEIMIPKSKKKKLQQLLNAVYQNTRMLVLRGFTRSEVNH